MKVQYLKAKRRLKRKAHVRSQITGSAERPRLTVFKSESQIYVQIINDVEGKTLVSASSIDKEIRSEVKAGMTKTAKSVLVGNYIAKRAKEANITKVAFDRNGYIYHGRVKALADAARQGGLEF
ncbi:MAG: 50S ribosomal protein L18 [Candidatus Kapabacteria bacterium]|nr:50S ribosomal protein L18 [Ignavibacteriota bacterium]MCW5884036.1 50S ribosomal protein L18 [Candidatus Kapabacteria bacterium]